MGNYFDSLKPKYDSIGLIPVPVPMSQATMLGAVMQPAMQPVQDLSPAPQTNSVGAGANPSQANPFDQFDTPAPAQAEPQQVAQQSAAPITQQVSAPAVSAAAVEPVSNNQVDLSPDQVARSEQWRADLGVLIARGASKDEIAARAAKEGIDLSQIDGLDAAIAWHKKHTSAPIPIALKTPEQPTPHDAHGQDRGKLDSFAAGALDSLGLGAADEVGAGVGAGLNSLGNVVGLGTGESLGDAYTRLRDENRQILSDDQHYNPGSFMAGQVAGGLASAAVGGGELSAGRAALEGAGLGGAYGFNSANGGFGDRLTEGAKGAALGGVLGGAVGGVAGKVARSIADNRATPSVGREVLNAADRLNAGVARADQIRPLPGHVSNGGAAALGTALLEPTLTGGLAGGLQGAAKRFDNAGAAALDRIADRAAGGTANDLTSVAAAANDAGTAGTLASYREDSRQAATSAYNNAEQLAGDVRLSTPRTINQIDRKLAEWSETPGGVPGSQALSDLRENLANGTFTVAGLRRLRTSFGDALDSNNRTVSEAAKSLWPTLSADITSGLRSAGKSEAATAYQAADRNYAQRISNLNVIDKVIGKDADLSADAVADRISRMSQSDYGKLGQAMSAIHPDQANQIRGGLITEMGKANAGKATEAGEFSFDSFATRWNKLSDQAKSALYTPGTIRDLNDLATLAGARRSVNQLGNPSRSGVFLENWKQGAKVVEAFGVGTAGIASPHALAAVGGAAMMGRVLAAPGVARALVRGSESRSIEFVSKRLNEAARRSPALSQNILGLRDYLTTPQHGVTVDGGGMPDQTEPMTGRNPFDTFD